MKVDLRTAVAENLTGLIIIISGLHLVVNLVWFRLMYAKPSSYEANLTDISVEPGIFFWFLISATIFDLGWLIIGIIMHFNREKAEIT